MSTPYQNRPFLYDNFGTSVTSVKKRRNKNRNQRRSQNRERLDSNASYNSGHIDGYIQSYRPRTESNVSAAHSAISAITNESKRGSNVGSDFGQNSGQQMGEQRQRNLRWDRDRLSREIWTYYLTHSQTQDLLTRKTRLKDALHKILTTNFPDYSVELYIMGSTATGLANNSSDVDICIVMTGIDSTSAEEKKPRSGSGVKVGPWKDSIKDDSESDGSEKKEKTEVGVIVNVDDTSITEQTIEKPNVIPESVTTNSPNNGKSDSSIPMLEKIEEVLKNYSFVTKIQIIPAKVPILKFNDRISGIEVTLNVNKLVSIRNTQLIHDYTKLDWRVQPLLLVIKAWAKDHNIKDAYNRSISSYSLVLMVIHYLQSACHPPVLPCLQLIDPQRYDPNADIHTIRMDRRPKRWLSHNESSLKELLLGFLDYYSYNFCFSKDAISVRLGGTLPKQIVQRYKSDDNSYSHWKYLSIEEPFNRTNTARSVYDEVMFEHILTVFRVSHYTLRRYPFLDSIMTGKQFSNEYASKTKPTAEHTDTNLYESTSTQTRVHRNSMPTI